MLTPLALLAFFYSRGLLNILKVKAAGKPKPLGELVWANLFTAGEWMWGLLTPPVALLALAAALWLLAFERSGAVLFALPEAGIPATEHFQFVEGWPSGYGVLELAAFIRGQSEATPGGVLVARTNYADHPLQSLNIYLTPSPSLSFYTVGDQSEPSVWYLAWQSARRRTLLVLITYGGVPQRVREPAAQLLKCGRSVWSYTRPGGPTGFVVLELNCGDLFAK